MNSRLGKKVRMIALGALAAGALSVAAGSALGATAHDAGKTTVSKSSHRLAVKVTAPTHRTFSVRLT